MSSHLFVTITYALAVFGTFHLVARMRGPRMVMAVPLGREATPEDRGRVRRFLRINAIVFGVALVMVFLAPGERAILLVGAASMISAAFLYYEIWAVAGSAEGSAPSRFAVPLDRGLRVRDLVSPVLQSLVVIVVAGSVLAVSALVEGLPERVPLRWDGGFGTGEVQYGSPAELWSLLPVMLFMVGLAWGTAWALAHQRLALDPERAEEHLRLEIRYRRLIARQVEVVALGLAVAIGAVWIVLAWSAGLGPGGAPRWAFAVPVVYMILLGLVVLIGFLPRIRDVRAAIADLTGPVPLGTRPDGWKLHGLFYFAPSDPALLVPVRLGMGITLNLGNWRAWLFLVALVAFLTFPAWL